MSILKDIYSKKYTPADPMKRMPFSLRLNERTFYNAVEEAMGPEFVERHWDGLCKAEDFKRFHAFREGFRLGVSLMLEVSEPRESAKAGR